MSCNPLSRAVDQSVPEDGVGGRRSSDCCIAPMYARAIQLQALVEKGRGGSQEGHEAHASDG
jgi:hypothetical protein